MVADDDSKDDGDDDYDDDGDDGDRQYRSSQVKYFVNDVVC